MVQTRTGLLLDPYFSALKMEWLCANRAEVRAASVAENLAALAPLDPVAAATLNPGDTTRIARALEMVWSTGRTLAHWQQQRAGGIGDAIDLKALILLPPRGWLHERCDLRLATMVKQGALEEVQSLLERGLDPDLPVMRAIGVRELLMKPITIDEMSHKVRSVLDEAASARHDNA